MADDLGTSVVSDASTSVADQSVVPTDPWNFDNVVDTESEPKTEPAKPEAPAGDKPVEKPVEKPKTEETPEKPLEDQALEEAFAETPEKPQDEPDIDKQDPQEMLNAQRNATAKEYLKRAERVYQPLKQFKYGEIKPTELQSKLTEFIGADKAGEYSQFLAHDLVDTNPDAAFKRIYAVKMRAKDPNWDPAKAEYPTLDTLLAAPKTTDAPAATQPSVDLSEITKNLDTSLEWDWRDPSLDENFYDDRERALAVTARSLEAKAKEETVKTSELQQKLDELNKQVEGLATKDADTSKAVFQTELNKNIQTFRSSVEEKILPLITKNAGLEVSNEDTAEVAAFKKELTTLYTGTAWERVNGMDSQFETFAYNESSVAKDIETVATRIVSAQMKAVEAKLAGRSEDVTKHLADVDAEKVPMINLMAQASKEFKKIRIAPLMQALGTHSSKLADPLTAAAERVEVTSGSAAGSQPPKQPSYDSAEAVWGAMVTDAEKEDALRATA